MKKILLSLLLLAIGCANGFAQTFEGKLYYRSMENHDSRIVKYSSGMAYNGARNTTFIVKGNKVLWRDECTHMCTLLDPDNNTITLYSDLIGQGMQFDYDKYAVSYLASFSEQGPSYMGHGNPPTLYRMETKGMVPNCYENEEGTYIKGRIENASAGTEIDIYKLTRYQMPRTIYTAQLYGIDAGDGLLAKFVWEQTNKVPMLGEMKSYVFTELTRIEEGPVEDAAFEIPATVKIDTSESPFKVVELYKSNEKYLEKKKMYPTQVDKEVVYKIDEEWDF